MSARVRCSIGGELIHEAAAWHRFVGWSNDAEEIEIFPDDDTPTVYACGKCLQVEGELVAINALYGERL